MQKAFNLFYNRNAGLCVKCSLAFLLAVIFTSCRHQPDQITLEQRKGKWVIALPWFYTKNSGSNATGNLKIAIAGNAGGQAVLGDFVNADGRFLFVPVAALSPGAMYQVWLNNKIEASVKVPEVKMIPPQVLAIYPQADTLPENLLKFYLKFSRPMRTGRALEHVHLLNSYGDTLQRVFLDLQPELWDSSGTVLTLWLDPGRIKRGLVLNHSLGNPLKTFQRYKLVVDSSWKSLQGAGIAKSFTKPFTAAQRQNQSPDITRWQIKAPKAGTFNPLIVNVRQALDHFLLEESISVLSTGSSIVQGNVVLSKDDAVWGFKPVKPWQAGNYKLQVNSRLEDLAGNNLNRVFDRDVRRQPINKFQEFYTRTFVCR